VNEANYEYVSFAPEHHCRSASLYAGYTFAYRRLIGV